MGQTRAEARRRVTANILAAARGEIAEHGGGGLSMRAIARSVGLVSSAIYRYFPTREALLTAMIVESYANLHAALGRAEENWGALAEAFREWAIASPHEFQLIYGTPVPGYAAPPETIPAAAAVAKHFLVAGATFEIDAFSSPALAGQMQGLVDTWPRVTASGAAQVLTELAALVGFVGLEISGHFVGTAEPADLLYVALTQRQAASLGLTACP